MIECQPIDTAPRDGTEILSWIENCRIISCYRILRYDVEEAISNRWLNQEFMISYDEDHIKGWMPLPTPPVPETPKIERKFISLLDMIVLIE